MALAMRRDPFARGEYERVCHGQGECAWCGQKRPRVYTYVWVRDDRIGPRTADHRRARTFCAFDCFSAFYS
jgi:predicted lipoprotein with Yx(FWY)xxD motif